MKLTLTWRMRPSSTPSRIMSGNSILRDGRSVNENYGTDLDKLEEGDRVGVVRTSNGDLVFFVNGVRDRACANDVS